MKWWGIIVSLAGCLSTPGFSGDGYTADGPNVDIQLYGEALHMYEFDDGAGDVIADGKQTLSLTARPTGSVTWMPAASAAAFNAPTAGAEGASESSAALIKAISDDNYTVEMWLGPPSTNADKLHAITTLRNKEGIVWGLFHNPSSNNALSLYYLRGFFCSEELTSADAFFETGETVHLVMTVKGSELKVYRNGSLVFERISQPTPSLSCGRSLRLALGSRSATPGYGGSYHRIVFFARDLLPEEIDALYARGHE